MQNPLRRPRNTPPERQVAEPKSERRSDPDGDGYVASDVRAHFVAMSGEFVGTTLFLFYAFAATQIANTLTPPQAPDLQQLLFISLAFGFSLAVTAWVFFRVSGGLFNPAVRSYLRPKYLNVVANSKIGDVRYGHYRYPASAPRSSTVPSTDAGWYGSRRLGIVHVPWTVARRNYTPERDIDHTGPIHRNVFDDRAGHHGTVHSR